MEKNATDYDYYETEIGTLTIGSRGGAVVLVRFGACPPPEGRRGGSALTKQAAREIGEYLSGERAGFSVPVKLCEGTGFQQKIWRALQEIPYGDTVSYGELAKRVGNPKACRAVGMANHRNPIAILVPCHRVIGADGSLTGYAGGIEKKKKLLELERQNRERFQGYSVNSIKNSGKE